MQKINKQQEPTSLKDFKRANPSARYPDLSSLERGEIRRACTAEQFYLCAYCCQAISGENDDTMNEHVEAQKLAPNRTLDFNNIVASCKTPKQCDASHGSQFLPLTPIMSECELELKFKLSGRVEGLTQRAIDSIRVLNLGDKEQNNKALIEKRKYLSESLLWTNGIDPHEGLEDDDLLNIVINDLLTPKHGKLEAFAPVVANILKDWMKT